MKRKIISLLLALIIAFGTMPLSTVFAVDTTSVVVTADKTSAYPGDTVLFTVSVGAVNHLMGAEFVLSIPSGMTYTLNSAAVAEGLAGKVGFVSADWTESTMKFTAYGDGDYSSADLTDFLTFSCKIDDNTLGEITPQITDVVLSDTNFEEISTSVNTDGAVVTVSEPPVSVTGVTLNKNTLSLYTGESETLTANLIPANPANKTVSWKSDDTSVATVDDNGKVTAIKKGSTTVTVTTADGGFTDTCTVDVACSHSNKTVHPAVASTCLVGGNGEYTTCDDCGEVISGSSAQLPLGDHNYIENVQSKYLLSAAQCNKKAVYYKSCSVCGAKSTETFESGTALGHDLIHHDAKAPTCTSIGWYAYDTCSRCDYTTYNERPALGHDLIHHDAKAPTCTAKGWDAYDTCSRCDYTTYNERAALGHDLIHHDAKAPTCTAKGWDAYDTCSRCDYTTYNERAALGHDLIHHDAKAPTCTEKGWDAYDTCSRCDYTTYNERPALGHDLIHHDAKAPTCTAKGWDAYDTCSRCDYTTYNERAALGHDLTHHNAKAPTCTEKGWDAYDTCSRCDYTTYNERPALGHDLIHHNAINPTCTEVGWDAYDTCSRCDYTTYHELEALDHDWDDGVVTTPVSCTVNGVKTYTCRRDPTHTKTEPIIASGHTPAAAVRENVNNPTCTANGSYDEVVYCSTCGAELSREQKTIITEGHKYSESWTSDTTNHWHVCTVCGAKSDIAKHTFVNDVCTVCGYIAVKVNFPDVNLKDWYGDAVSYAVSAGLMKGYGSGKFGTADGIQRQDFVVILSRLSGDDLSKYEGKSSFKDVPTNAYYTTALAWAKAVGVSSGYANGKFGVGDKVTREQIVTFLYNYAKLKGYNITVTDEQKVAIRAQYPDFKDISSYAQEAAYWALSRGVISGKSIGGKKLIAPKANAQRCEVAAMFYNIEQKNIFTEE